MIDAGPMMTRSRDTELGALRTLVLVALVLAVPVALITTTIRVAISEQALYDYSVREFDAATASDIPESELVRANSELRDYIVDEDAGPLAIRVTEADGSEAPLFNAREISHMRDVRDLVQLMFTVQMIAVAVVIALSVIMVALWPVRVLAAGLIYGAALTGAIFGAVAILAVAGFDSAWSEFHTIAFTNDLWQLDPDTDHLIQMYPQEFWFQASMLIAGAVLLQAILIALVATGYLLISRQKTDSSSVSTRPALPGRAGHSRLPGDLRANTRS
jgi:integral membrane protein (TIGR01906 family)